MITMSKKEILVFDADFSMFWRDVNPLVREGYHIIKGIFGSAFVERLLQLADLPMGRRIEYFIEGLGSQFLLGDASALVAPDELKQAHDCAHVGLVTRLSERDLLPSIDENGLAPYIDIIIGREQAGYGVMTGEHIRMCIGKMGCGYNSAIIGADSPSQINTGNMLGAETWLFRKSYHPLPESRCRPTRTFDTIHDGIVWYNREGYSRQHEAL